MCKFKKPLLLAVLLALLTGYVLPFTTAAPPSTSASKDVRAEGLQIFERRLPEGYDEIVGVLRQAHRDGHLSLGEYLLLRHRLKDPANLENLKESLTHAAEVSDAPVPKAANGKVDWAALLTLFMTQILPILLKLIGGL